MYTRITFFHTLYQKEVTWMAFGAIRFEDGRIVFHSGGHGYAVEFEYVRSIEPVKE